MMQMDDDVLGRHREHVASATLLTRSDRHHQPGVGNVSGSSLFAGAHPQSAAGTIAHQKKSSISR
jgi:hypothetical protein